MFDGGQAGGGAQGWPWTLAENSQRVCTASVYDSSTAVWLLAAGQLWSLLLN